MGLVAKLKFKPAAKLLVLNLPDAIVPSFDEMAVKTSLAGKGLFEQVLLFTKDSKAVEASVSKVLLRLAPDATFWIAYPKKSGSISSDITRDNGWNILTEAGYDGVAAISIDDDWSALRFRKSEAIGVKLRDTPMNERSIEGVDFTNRTAVLPKDAVTAMKGYKGLADFFDSMSFTHKKEYIEAILEAKKPETRQRRIEKMIEMVQKLKAAKENKKK